MITLLVVILVVLALSVLLNLSLFFRMESSLRAQVKDFGDSFSSHLRDISGLQKNQLDSLSDNLSKLTAVNEQKLESMRSAMEVRLESMQADNNVRLEQMRQVVDEKLHTTLEKRLGDSFKLVSDRLELVHKGLGEMQALATGVGDLKKVLANVKARGVWGEIQLASILEQIFAPEQYSKNVMTKKGSNEYVEFALKLPGKDDTVTWIPIDAKFPKEDYERLVEAQEQANPVLVEELGRALENRIKQEAKDIRDKYIDPPHTTDFAIMFLPIEGLYAEVLRRSGLSDFLQRQYRVTVTGPTTIAAFLNSLQMGFRTLAIEKRASEIWNLLAAVKKEFGNFGELLERTEKQLKTATETLGDAARKSRTIETKLKKVQGLPSGESLEITAE